jgi:hypothetical protein
VCEEDERIIGLVICDVLHGVDRKRGLLLRGCCCVVSSAKFVIRMIC